MASRTPASRQRKPKQRKPSRSAVGFIGGGNMATALIKGFVSAGLYDARELCASDVDAAKRMQLKRQLHVDAYPENGSVARRARIIILAVKPQIMDAVLTEIRPYLTPSHVVISIAAGITTRRLEAGLGGKARVVRVMPNTPALLGEGMAVAVRGRYAKVSDEHLAVRLMRAVGKAVAVRDERLLDAVTGLSGSGPAFVYLFAEALIVGGVQAGLKPDLAAVLALQTLRGAAAMLQDTGETPHRLREMVTSPNGTTFAGLNELARRDFVGTVARAVMVATRRSVELGQG